MEKTANIEIRIVPVERIIDLRHRILRAGLPIETAHFGGDREATSIHLAAIAGDEVIGCATLHRNAFAEEAAYQLRGMAVETRRQRAGVGRLLLAEVDRQVAKAGGGLLWANCRTPAVPFYEKLGWRIVSEEFVVPTAGPHFRMTKMVANSQT